MRALKAGVSCLSKLAETLPKSKGIGIASALGQRSLTCGPSGGVLQLGAVKVHASSRILQQNNITGVTEPCGSRDFHTCPVLLERDFPKEPKKWPRYNDIVYPPRQPGEPIRPAEVFHYRANIKYSPKKMWYIASMIRGMSIDEALKQLSFVSRTGSKIVKEVLLEAQELAVQDHNVEYKSNLWVADSHVGRAMIVKGMRKHAGPRFGTVHYRYCHYFVCLREGPPPEQYYTPWKETGNEKMEGYLQKLRKRRVWGSL